jgi:hypothetical protein
VVGRIFGGLGLHPRDHVQEDWVNMHVTSKGHLWWDMQSPDQLNLFDSYIELSQEFFDAITAQRWPGEFRQAVKWIFCLSAARMPRIRSKNDEASTPEPQPGFQGEGGVGRHQGREDAG